jgi:hypothetical protein
MSTCNDCIYYEGFCDRKTIPSASTCRFFKDRSKFTELKSAQWVKHKPEIEKMREFHRLGIGKAMGENSIFWTCSICGGWGNLSQKYCSNCGAKMENVE